MLVLGAPLLVTRGWGGDDDEDGNDEDGDNDELKRGLDGLRRRLNEVLRKHQEARAHKMRTIHFRRRKHDIIRDLDAVSALEMKDYSGKLEARKSKQGTSENLGKKLSNHGSIFVFRNPAAAIREKHPLIDWTQFPAASEDVFLQVNCFVATDDSSQSAYHMGCVMEISYKELKDAFPWLEGVIPYSDQCGDYHSTGATVFNHAIGRLTGIHVVRSEHSEVGEGKGEVDMKFGILAQQFYSTLARSRRECADHLFDHLEEVRREGDYNVLGEIDRSLFKKGSPGAIPFHNQSQCVVHHKDGGITLHEFVGIGKGKHVSEEELQKFDHYEIMTSSSGTGSQAMKTTAGPMVPVVRTATHAHQKAAKKAKTERETERQEKRDSRAAEDATARAAAVETHTGKSSAERQQLTCEACGGAYLTRPKFDKHKEEGGVCERKQKVAASKASKAKNVRLAAERIMATNRKQQDEEEQEELEQLSEVVVEIKAAEDAKAITFEVANESGGVVVKCVDPRRVSVALEVLKGYRLKTVESGGTTVISALAGGGCGGGGGGGGSDEAIASAARATLSKASADNHVRVAFSKPPPAMPRHGWARKNLHVDSNNRVMPMQKKWLEEHCDAYEKKGSSPRHTGVYTAMVNLHGLLHIADDKPFVMSETAIFNWLKRRWATQKAAGINLALAVTAMAANPAVHEEEEKEDVADDDDEVDYGVMLLAPLRELLRSRELDSTGRKAELIERLIADDGWGGLKTKWPTLKKAESILVLFVDDDGKE